MQTAGQVVTVCVLKNSVSQQNSAPTGLPRGIKSQPPHYGNYIYSS